MLALEACEKPADLCTDHKVYLKFLVWALLVCVPSDNKHWCE